uniref:Uncharacterized protein n=1 Tax=Rhizophora mucronata TaxID=61149 RepID=A0A2P2PC05_RHIMU
MTASPFRIYCLILIKTYVRRRQREKR